MAAAPPVLPKPVRPEVGTANLQYYRWPKKGVSNDQGQHGTDNNGFLLPSSSFHLPGLFSKHHDASVH
jgi:hypothetical protein